MVRTRFSRSARSMIYFVAVLAFTVSALMVVNRSVDSGSVSAQSGPVIESPAAVFPGTGVGSIPDGLAGTPPQYGAPLVVSFAVTGITAPLTDISVDMNITHTWVGDVDVVLAAPGGSPSMVVVSRIGVTTAGSFGDSSNYGGLYNFTDSASSTAAANIWSVALGTNGNPACDTSCIVTAGSYRTTEGGTTGQVSPAPVTSLMTTFSGLTTGQLNGTWTLTFRDAGAADIGSVSAANLTLVGGAPPTPSPTPALADFDGDGFTDYAVVRAPIGSVGEGSDPEGIGSQATWHISHNVSGIPRSQDWGLAGDTFVPADFDGDGKSDFAVWRPGSQGTFYVIRSQTNTILVTDFGTEGDDASVVGDYNNDGRDDFAVYRSGTTPGSQSTWYWTYGGNVYSMPWGINGDYVAPGDYDGDGKNDVAVQRTNGANGDFYIRYTGGGADTVTTFGLAGDIVVPGDYDGDLKTDLCVMSPSGPNWLWTYRPSLGGADIAVFWGLVATDLPAPGDYNGDGRADFAVWRFGALSTFYSMNSNNFQARTRQWGLLNDNPATLSYSH